MDRRKRLLWIGLSTLAALLVLPVFLLSSPMMGFYQRRIDADPESRFSKWLQIATADINSSTWRPEQAASGYRLFYERHPLDERRPHAFLRYGQSLEESGRTADAVDIYQKFIIQYPELEERQEAEQGINRIRLCRTP